MAYFRAAGIQCLAWSLFQVLQHEELRSLLEDPREGASFLDCLSIIAREHYGIVLPSWSSQNPEDWKTYVQLVDSLSGEGR